MLGTWGIFVWIIFLQKSCRKIIVSKYLIILCCTKYDSISLNFSLSLVSSKWSFTLESYVVHKRKLIIEGAVVKTFEFSIPCLFRALSSLVSNRYSSVASADLFLLLGKCTWALKEVSSLSGLHFVGKTNTVSLDRVIFSFPSVSSPFVTGFVCPIKGPFPTCFWLTWVTELIRLPVHLTLEDEGIRFLKNFGIHVQDLQLMSTQYEAVIFFWLLFLWLCMCSQKCFLNTIFIWSMSHCSN